MSDFNLMSFLIDKEERKSKQEDMMDPGSIWDYGSGGAGMVGDDFLNFDNFLKMDDEVVNFDLLGDPCSGGGLFDHRAPLVDDSGCSDSGVSSTLSPPHGLSEEELSIKCTPTPSELNYAATTPTQSIFSEDIDMSDTSSMDILISMDPADSDSSHPTPPTAGQTSTVPASAGKKTTAPGSASHSTASAGQAPVKKPAGSGKGKTSMGKKKSVPACAASSQSQQQAPPSILIPVNLPGLKTIKVVNASGKPLSSETLGEISSKTGLAGPQLKLISSGFQPLSPGQTVCNMLGSISNGLASLGSPAQSNSTSCTDDEDFDEEEERVVMEEGEDGDSIYPRLELTYEERRLMEKEGVRLPSHYPLTKLEERELKRIRRKIRNKISAQDSRKRKKEYVDGLEERVKKCTEDNVTLLKRIKQLEARNHTLCSQLRKIQTLLTNKSKLKSRLSTAHQGAPSKTTPGGGAPGLLTSTQVQSSTCLMVLCLSLALILAPNLQTGGGALSPDTMGEAPSEGSLEKTVQHATSGRSRSLLFTKYALGGPQHTPAPAHPLTAELVEEAYAQLLAGGVRGAPPAPDEPRGAPPRGDAGGLGGLLADLGELLSFKSAPVQVKEEEEEREVIEIKEEAEDYDAEVCEVKQELGGGGGCGEKKAEPDLQILYNDHNYGKPVVRKRSAAFLDDYGTQGGGYKKHSEYIPAEKKPSLEQGYKKYPEYIPAEKKASLELEPLISLLAAARESLGKAAQGPRILDSPVDDFVPKSLRSPSVNLVSSTSSELGNARQGSFNRSSRRLVEREENYIEVE